MNLMYTFVFLKNINMKSTFKLLGTFIIASIIALTSSCSKDNVTTELSPTVTLTDSLGKNVIKLGNALVYVKIDIALVSGTTISSIKFERVFAGGAREPIYVNSNADVVKNYPLSSVYIDNLIARNLTIGYKIDYYFTVVDSKGKTSTGTVTYDVVRNNEVLISPIIELGGQNNNTIPYKFLGTADNFATYTAGVTGTAKANSSKIDFVYYFGQNDENAFAAPSNTDGAQVIWNSEINGWPTKNFTVFKSTTITSTEFDNMVNVTKGDDLFYNIDFTTGTTDKIIKIKEGNVFAFRTVENVIGIVKFSQIASASDGSMKVQLITKKF